MKVPLTGVKEYSRLLPVGSYICSIDEFEPGEDRNGFRQYMLRMIVEEPAEMQGRTLLDWFRVGMEGDAQCSKKETAEHPENRGAQRLMLLLNCSHTPTTDEDTQWMRDGVGNTVGVSITTYKDQNGVTRNSINYDFAESTTPGIATDSTPIRGKRGPAAAARAARAGSREVDADEDELEEVKPRRGGMATMKREVEEPEEEPEEEEEVEERPVRRGPGRPPAGARDVRRSR